jgi:hypothetical protein
LGSGFTDQPFEPVLAQRVNRQQTLGMFNADQMLGVKRWVAGTAVAFHREHVGPHRVLMHSDAQPVKLVPKLHFPLERHFQAFVS